MRVSLPVKVFADAKRLSRRAHLVLERRIWQKTLDLTDLALKDPRPVTEFSPERNRELCERREEARHNLHRIDAELERVHGE